MNYFKLLIFIVLLPTFSMQRKRLKSWPQRHNVRWRPKKSYFYFVTYPENLTLKEMNQPINHTITDLTQLGIMCYIFPSKEEVVAKMHAHYHPLQIPIMGPVKTSFYHDRITTAMILEIRSLVKNSIIQRTKFETDAAQKKREEQLLERYKVKFADYFGGPLPAPEDIENDDIHYD